MVITLDAKRRLTVPVALAPAKPGDYFDARFDAEEDALVFRRLAGRENWLEVLKTCPVSGEELGKMGEPVNYLYGTTLVRLCCKDCVGGLKKDPDAALKKLAAAK